jgi:REP element-mobilizing transposase RayT
VSLADTPFYHVTSRCVRRAYLCGKDQFTGRDYEHRRGWLEDRLRVLSSLFSIHLCAYAVMSNHYHLVVKLTPEESNFWSDDDVLNRWTALFRGPVLVQRYRAGETLTDAELKSVQDMAAVYRERLSSLSWFMKCLNEPIARKANAEDHCTGHFWEARFSSQPLRSPRALFTAMAYVDLNPIRAKKAISPEQSDHTSIKARIEGNDGTESVRRAIARMLTRGELNHGVLRERPLLAFEDDHPALNETAGCTEPLHMRRIEYLRLVDESGRVGVRGKRGRIDPSLEPILERLGLSATQWVSASTTFRLYYRRGEIRLTQAA